MTMADEMERRARVAAAVGRVLMQIISDEARFTGDETGLRKAEIAIADAAIAALSSGFVENGVGHHPLCSVHGGKPCDYDCARDYTPKGMECGSGEMPAGMKPWAGGDSAPDDWDGGPVLLEAGCIQSEVCEGNWFPIDPDEHREINEGCVVAYTPKPAPIEWHSAWDAGLSPSEAEETAYVAASNAACCLYPGDDEAGLRDAFCQGASYSTLSSDKPSAPVVSSNVEEAISRVEEMLNVPGYGAAIKGDVRVIIGALIRSHGIGGGE